MPSVTSYLLQIKFNGVLVASAVVPALDEAHLDAVYTQAKNSILVALQETSAASPSVSFREFGMAISIAPVFG